jgi:hypothetical protein
MEIMDTAIILFIYLAIGWPIAKHLMKKGRQGDGVTYVEKLISVNSCTKRDLIHIFVALWMFWLIWIFLHYLEKIVQWTGGLVCKALGKP